MDEDDDDEKDSDKDENEDELRDDWVSVIYTINIIIKESELKAEDLRVSFKMGKLKLIGKVDVAEDIDVDQGTKKMAEV